jgi:hypothetical protein
LILALLTCGLSEAFEFLSIKLVCGFLYFVRKWMYEYWDGCEEEEDRISLGLWKELGFLKYTFYLHKPFIGRIA